MTHKQFAALSSLVAVSGFAVVLSLQGTSLLSQATNWSWQRASGMQSGSTSSPAASRCDMMRQQFETSCEPALAQRCVIALATTCGTDAGEARESCAEWCGAETSFMPQYIPPYTPPRLGEDPQVCADAQRPYAGGCDTDQIDACIAAVSDGCFVPSETARLRCAAWCTRPTEQDDGLVPSEDPQVCADAEQPFRESCEPDRIGACIAAVTGNCFVPPMTARQRCASWCVNHSGPDTSVQATCSETMDRYTTSCNDQRGECARDLGVSCGMPQFAAASRCAALCGDSNVRPDGIGQAEAEQLYGRLAELEQRAVELQRQIQDLRLTIEAASE